jgi:hypothetical protein
MKSRFPWNIALLYCSRLFFELSQCCFQASRPVYPRLPMWQWALDKWSTLPFAISEIISRHTPTSPNSITPRDVQNARSIRLMKRVVLVSQARHGLIWPVIVTRLKWFMIFNLLIKHHQKLAVRRGRVLHRRDYDLTHLRSDISKPLVLLHLLLLWYINET